MQINRHRNAFVQTNKRRNTVTKHSRTAYSIPLQPMGNYLVGAGDRSIVLLRV
jgi:hypothetical protein